MINKSDGSPLNAATFVVTCAAALIAVCLLLHPQSAVAADAMAQTGTKFKADADMQSVLDALAAMKGKPIESLTPAEARAQPTPTDAVMAVLKKQGKDTQPTALVPGVTSTDREIPGAAGPMAARVYTPAGKGPFPVVVYFHGGGWVIANKEIYDGGARGIAKQANAIVISVDYRLAPEAKFPAAWDDAFAAYKWAAANAVSINGNPKKMGLAGESAGANLAISTAIAVRDTGLQKPLAVLAVYPVAQTGNLSTASYVDSATAKPLNKAMIEWFVGHLFKSPADKADPRIDLVRANLAGLPPVTIINAQIDPLREDGMLIADALKKAGVKVDRRIYDGVTHEFFGTAAAVKDAGEAQKYAGQQLRQAFSN